MSDRADFSDGCLLRIYCSESATHGGRSLHEHLVRAALDAGLAGATAMRGFMGFGSHGRVHTAKVLRLAEDLPVVVEIIDARDRIEAFVAAQDAALRSALVTRLAVNMRSPRAD